MPPASGVLSNTGRKQGILCDRAVGILTGGANCGNGRYVVKRPGTKPPGSVGCVGVPGKLSSACEPLAEYGERGPFPSAAGELVPDVVRRVMRRHVLSSSFPFGARKENDLKSRVARRASVGLGLAWLALNERPERPGALAGETGVCTFDPVVFSKAK